MCPEFFLALLYLIIVMIINFFLLKLMKSSTQKFQNFLKFRNFLIYSKKWDEKNFSKIYKNFQEKFKGENRKKDFLFLKPIDDILIIGNLSKLFSNSFEEKNIFFSLLEKQYLSTKIDVK